MSNEYIPGLPESTEADFLSGRMGFAMGFDNTNQIMVGIILRNIYR